MSGLAGSTVLVVGATGGIGSAVARRAHGLGARLVLCSRDGAALRRLAEELDGARTSRLDVTSVDETTEILGRLGHVDHVYYAAGGFVGGDVVSGSLDALRAAFDTRIWGAMNVVRALAPRMSAGGSVTLTGGVSTARPVRGAFASALATAAAEQMARALAIELAPIRVNAVSPGWTDTAMWDPILGEAKAETFAGVASKLLVGRIAHPDEVAEAVLFLAANGSVTGEVLHVDGGHRLV